MSIDLASRLIAGVVGACLLSFLPAAVRADDPDNPMRLRVMTYNIHHGEGTDGKLDLSRIAEVIRAANADLVALQEVDQRTQRTGGVDQTAELGRLTGLHAVFGGNIPLQGGQYGNAVLSRWPIKRHENHPLPSLGPGEKRGVLEVEIGQPQALLIFATHLDHRPVDRERMASAEAINRLADRSKLPLAILAGDLNDEPDSGVLTLFKQAWSVPGSEPQLTSPSVRPRRQIDYILPCRTQGWKLVEIHVIGEPVASDHRPLVATFELPPE